MIRKLSSTIHSFFKVNKKYCSSNLYLPYNQTSDTCVVIEPYVDLEHRLQNITILKNNITLRGLTNINIDKIYNNWPKFVLLRDEFVNLNVEKKKLIEQLKKTIKDNGDECNRLRENKIKVMNRLKELRYHISILEKDVVIPSLGVPNSLHPECPLTEATILFQFIGTIKSNNEHCVHHVNIGEALDCLDYLNSVIVYLKNDAALCEQAAMAYFGESLEQLDFIPFCNSDLIKSVIVEGCGVNFDNADKTIILNEKNLHLVGGASLQSFCAFLAKQSVGGNKLPLKLFACGRSYKPTNNDDGLFSAVQSNSVKIFVGSTDECTAKEQFDQTLTFYKQLYNEIGLDYRIVYLPVSKLNNWESLTAQIELYSVSCQKYIAVGSLSLSGDFISKRLRIYWSGKNKHSFLHIVSGKIIDTNILMACLLETNKDKLIIPECFKKYMIV